MLVLHERKCIRYSTMPWPFSSTSQVLLRVRDYADSSHRAAWNSSTDEIAFLISKQWESH